MQEAVVAPLAALLLAACCRTAHAAGLMTSAACRLRYAFEVGCLLCRGAWLVCPIWRSQRVGALSWIELWKTVAATFPARKAAPLASCLLTVFLVEESDDDQDDPGRQSGRFSGYCVSGAARRRARAARARGWLCYSVARQTPLPVLVVG